MLEIIIKEIRKGMMANPNSPDVKLSKETINYLLKNLERYKAIEKEMKERFKLN